MATLKSLINSLASKMGLAQDAKNVPIPVRSQNEKWDHKGKHIKKQYYNDMHSFLR